MCVCVCVCECVSMCMCERVYVCVCVLMIKSHLAHISLYCCRRNHFKNILLHLQGNTGLIFLKEYICILIFLPNLCI